MSKTSQVIIILCTFPHIKIDDYSRRLSPDNFCKTENLQRSILTILLILLQYEKYVFFSWHAFWKEGFNINSINIDIKRKQKKRLAPPLVHLEVCTCECPRAAGRENTELNARLLTFGTLLSTTAVSKSTIHIFELSLKTPWKTHHCANFKVISWTKFSLASADAFDYIQSWERVPKKHK